jgi:AMP nucleosidase
MISTVAGVRDVQSFDDADAAVERIAAIYHDGVAAIEAALEALARGETPPRVEARYPWAGFEVERADLNIDARQSFGMALEAGAYGATLTRPDLFADYYRDQIAAIMKHHGVPFHVGIGPTRMPLPFVVESRMIDLVPEDAARLQDVFALPELRRIDDSVANGTRAPGPGQASPLSLFDALRTDFSLARLSHYTGSPATHVQSFILLTNYQRYVDSFVEYGRSMLGQDGFEELVEPGEVITRAAAEPDRPYSAQLPQMPAYHLKRAGGDGITMVNIGVGPSNAKTITDHLAVLRPHCWLMVGHCAGLRRSQALGDYVLAHGYVRDDKVLDADLPVWAPVPPIAEVQVALTEAVGRVTGLKGRDMKSRVRTGTVFTTADRNWELRFSDHATALNQSRAIAVDMESATIAANGFRFRVPYGTLLCVSDKPAHGELKLGGVADSFYRERVRQHLMVGIETLRLLREEGVDRLHSRKLRSFDEPPFR